MYTFKWSSAGPRRGLCNNRELHKPVLWLVNGPENRPYLSFDWPTAITPLEEILHLCQKSVKLSFSYNGSGEFKDCVKFFVMARALGKWNNIGGHRARYSRKVSKMAFIFLHWLVWERMEKWWLACQASIFVNFWYCQFSKFQWSLRVISKVRASWTTKELSYGRERVWTQFVLRSTVKGRKTKQNKLDCRPIALRRLQIRPNLQ